MIQKALGSSLWFLIIMNVPVNGRVVFSKGLTAAYSMFLWWLESFSTITNECLTHSKSIYWVLTTGSFYVNHSFLTHCLELQLDLGANSYWLSDKRPTDNLLVISVNVYTDDKLITTLKRYHQENYDNFMVLSMYLTDWESKFPLIFDPYFNGLIVILKSAHVKLKGEV